VRNAALMRHVREVDSATRTVVMIQMENEVGLLGDTRDRWQRQRGVRRAGAQGADGLSREEQEHAAAGNPKVWDSAGAKTSGSWERSLARAPARTRLHGLALRPLP